MANETYHIEVRTPLLRPGLTVSTKVSKRHLKFTLEELLKLIRAFNCDQEKQR